MTGIRKEQAERTRQAVVEATRELIGEKGYEGVRIGDIAKRCGIGMGTLYHYFKGKDDIFNYIERGRFAEHAREVLEAQGGSIEERLRAYLLGWCERVAEDDPNMARAWYRMAVDRRLPNAEGRTHLDDDFDNLSALLAQAIETGELRKDAPVELLAWDLVYTINGAALARCTQYAGLDVAAWGQAWCDELLPARLAPWRA